MFPAAKFLFVFFSVVFQSRAFFTSALDCFFLTVSGSEAEEEDENEFFDAVADGGQNSNANDHFTLDITTRTGVRRNSSDSSSEAEETQETKQV